MNTVTVGIDLAKNVFALHGVDQSGKAVFIKPKVVRSRLLDMVAHLPPCLIGLDERAGALTVIATVNRKYWPKLKSDLGSEA